METDKAADVALCQVLKHNVRALPGLWLQAFHAPVQFQVLGPERRFLLLIQKRAGNKGQIIPFLRLTHSRRRRCPGQPCAGSESCDHHAADAPTAVCAQQQIKRTRATQEPVPGSGRPQFTPVSQQRRLPRHGGLRRAQAQLGAEARGFCSAAPCQHHHRGAGRPWAHVVRTQKSAPRDRRRSRPGLRERRKAFSTGKLQLI